MEPMVVFSAGLVAYCTYRALLDALRDLRGDGTGEMLGTLFRHRNAGLETRTTAIVSGLAKSPLIFAKGKKRPKPVPAGGFTEWHRQGALL